MKRFLVGGHRMSASSGLESRIKENPIVPDLSDFMDYRLYLRDFYNFKRRITAQDLRPYSYAIFASAADIKSPNYLKLVIDGQRNLSDGMAEKFARAAGLNRNSTEEFIALVRYTQAQDPVERSQYLKSLSDIRVQSKMNSGEINAKTWDSIPGWVSWMILQLVEIRALNLEPSNIARILNGKVNADAVRKAIDGLIASNLLERDPVTMGLKKTRHLMESPREMPPDMIRKLQTELILLGLDSLFKDSTKEREFGTLTLSLTRDEFEKLKFEMKHLRKRWQREYTDHPPTGKPERLYQFNVQLFPLSDEIADLRGTLVKSPTAEATGAVAMTEETAESVAQIVSENLSEADVAIQAMESQIVSYSSRFTQLTDDALPPHALYTPTL